MKGLLLKDAYQAWKYYKVFYLVAVVMEVTSIWVNGNLFLVVYPFFLMGMVPFNLMSMDESGKWDIYCGSLPCTRKQIVTGKYLLGIGTALPALGLVILCQALGMSLRGSIRWGELGSFVAVCAVLMLLFPSVSLPLSFRYGTTKGRMIQMILVGAFCGAAALLALAVEDGMPLPGRVGAGALVLGMCGVYGLSWYLSVRFYEKRDLG